MRSTRLSSQTLQRLAAAAYGNPSALLEVAKLYLAHGDSSEAGRLALQAVHAEPDGADVTPMARAIFSRVVPSWHFEIVRDVARNNAYESALRRRCAVGGRVLDIGTGSGLLAMLALRAGASRVFGCESSKVMAEIAKAIVTLNGFESQIEIIARHSADLEPDRDLGGKVDVVVSEIVSNNLLGQGVLPVIRDVVNRCLRPGGRVIPARATVKIALANYTGPKAVPVTTVAGFDLSPLNQLAGQARPLSVGDPALELQSHDASAFEFDFESGRSPGRRQTVVGLESNGGRVNGVAQWISLALDEDTHYENRPGLGRISCWSVLFYPFSEARFLERGRILRIHASHDSTTLYLNPRFERDPLGSLLSQAK